MRHFPESWTVEARTGRRLRGYRSGPAHYDVAVAMPEGDPPAAGFPLLLVMDGALHFDAVAAAAAALARRPAKTGVLPTLVVGIASGGGWTHDAARRGDDLVPGSAGADRLLALVRDRIVPDVAALAAEDGAVDGAATAILGHSLGGLFALHALAAAPFRDCIAVSPSLWRLPDLSDRVADALRGRDSRVLLAAGGREPRRSPDLADAARSLSAVASVTRVELADEDHGSIPFALLPVALRFVHGSGRAGVEARSSRTRTP